jgi:hypothetical protein
MFAVILQAAGGGVDASQEAVQALLDGAAQGNVVLAIVGGVVLAALVVLGILKKDHPLVQPIAGILLKLGRTFSKPKANPADQQGVAAVVPIKKLDQEQK